MKHPKFAFSSTAFVTALTALLLPLVFSADGPAGFTRKMLLDQDLSVANHHGVIAAIDFGVGGAAPWHTHPGEELGYVIEGTVVLEIDGKPAQTLKAGDPFIIPAGTIHTAKNGGNVPAKVVSSYVLEKGKPLATSVTK